MPQRHYVPDAPQFDRGMTGGASAIVVAMVNSTDGFDVNNSQHQDAIVEAIGKVIPAYIAAVIKGQAELGRERYAE
jgi:hypothetical protein